MLGVLIALIFYDGLRVMVNAWSNQEEYGHGFLIPVISAFLVWQKKDKLALCECGGAWSGLLVLVAGILFYLVGELSSLYIIVQYAFLVVLYGVVITLIGWRGVGILWAPLIFLFFMIPLPNFLYQSLSAQLQLISSEMGVAVIRWFGISVFLEGNVIDLGSYKLQVVEACSGLRYLFPLTSLAFLMAYIFKASLWKRIVVFLSSIPITILMNSFRIGVIGVLVEYGGPEQAEGFLHDFEGWIVFMACLLILLLEMFLLTRIGPRSKSFKDVFAIEFPEDAPHGADVRFRSIPRPFIAAGALLFLTLVSVTTFVGGGSEVVPARKVFAEFPMALDGWQGRRDQLERIYLDALKLDDYIIADYTNEEGRSINFYSAYYASQSKGESAHSPRSCLPGGGWKIEELQAVTLGNVLIGDAPLTVNRVVIRKGDYTQLVYYWFQGRGRIITSEYMVKWYLLLDSIARHRTDGALIRLTMLLPPGQDIRTADEALTSFAASMSSQIQEYVPD